MCLCAFQLPALNYYSYKIGKADGLNSVFVRGMLQDSTGYMWFGTINGLCRYDGYVMKEIIGHSNIDQNLVPDNRVVNIYLWGKSFLWIKLRGNLFCCYDLQTQRFVDYTGSRQYRRSFRTGVFVNPHEAWLLDRKNGCRRITFDGNTFKCTDLTTANHRLPSDDVNFVTRSHNGGTWIATTRGLVLYKRERVRTMLKGVSIKGMTIVRGTEVFVSDKGGIYSYTHGKMQRLRKEDTVFPMVTACAALPEKGSLIVTTKADTYKFNILTRAMKYSTLMSARNCRIATDNRGNKTVCNDNGEMLYIDIKGNRCHRINLFGDNASDHGDLRLSFVTTRDRKVCVSTFGYGLFVYDLEMEQLEHIQPRYGENDIINTNNLHGIYEDSGGKLWISQEDLGLSCVEILHNPSVLIPLEQGKRRAERNNEINSVRMLQRGSDGNLIAANMLGNAFVLRPNLIVTPKHSHGDVLSMARDRQGLLWTGTRSQGLFIGDRQYKHDGSDASSLSADKISDMLCDGRGRMWIATFGGGLDEAEWRNGDWRFLHFFQSGKEVSETRTLTADHKGRLWLGTGGGVFVFYPNQLLKNSKQYMRLNANKNPKMDEVHAMMEDSRHRVWVCISGSGVLLYDNNGKTPRLIRHFSTADGLGDDMTQSVVEDRLGRVWIGTNNGISSYDEKTGKFHNHIYSFNPWSNICMESAALMTGDGRLAFGTKAGVLLVPAMDNAADMRMHPMAITDVYVNGIPVSQLKGDIRVMADKNGIPRMTLGHEKNSLTIFFSDFTFDNRHTSLYTYKLEGYDKDWMPASAINFTMYKNLPPGRYTFHVRLSGTDGEEKDGGAVMEFVVRPPIWGTWYAYLFYLLFAGFFAFVIYRQVKRVNELHNRVKVERQLTEYKLQFFTNISHEFRTPLTIIQGAMERISTTENVPGALKQPLSSMQKSVKRMMRLINHLLDFRKVQAGKARLLLEDTEVVEFIRDIFFTFRDVADNKRINYQFTAFAKAYQMFVDRRKLDSIIYNLISNAIKYTPDSGDIYVRLVQPDKQHIALEVKDNGIGISKDKQKELFQRFMQSSFAYDSIGIGLYLSNEFAKLHKGTITFRENPEGGSIFTLTLPTDKSVYAESDFAEPATQMIVDAEQDKKKAWLVDYKEIAPEPMNDSRVLVVEDDNDVREYIVTELQPYFKVSSAFNGEEAWKMIQKERPDLVVSDVAMPIMTGYKLTKLIREDDATCDLPVILLTALTDDAKRAKGYEMGADDYIQKPFSVKVLITRCTQLLQQRERLKSTFSQKENTAHVAPTVVFDSRDKKFRETLDSWIYSHIDDPDLNVDALAESMGYGRTTFYRKVSLITGMTPSNYIRSVRMEEAGKLVAESNLTIAEISYRVGINNPFYFSKMFKEHFGMPPRDFRNKQK